MMIFLAGLISGFIDAIAGGGGLIMIPALLFSGFSVPEAVATNKLCGTAGVLTSSVKFTLSRHVDLKLSLLMGVPAIFGAVLGSHSIEWLPRKWATPVIIVLLFAITLFILFRPDFGKRTNTVSIFDNIPESRRMFLLSLCGFAIGFHDGFFGPGAGSLLAFSLVCFCSLDFLRATGTAKIVNFLTNLAALITFWFSGLIHFETGVIGALGTILGSYLGATFATKKGVAVIKPVFLTVTFFIIGKLIWDQLGIK